MKVDLTERQKFIVKSLRRSGTQKVQRMLEELENGNLAMADIEGLCAVINGEFMMEGILPSFEPNAYGIELEDLLDTVNRARIRPGA